jgi:hypothetical protein
MDTPRPRRAESPDGMLESIRQGTSYQLLRTFITATSALAIAATVIGGLIALTATHGGGGMLIVVLSTALSIVAALAGRMFALMLVDIADTLQWQCRHMAKVDRPE